LRRLFATNGRALHFHLASRGVGAMQSRYDVLDGLRGTAALSVVALHLLNVFFPVASSNPLHHAYLAVDFFYMLSGFVVGYAYDRRWGRMGLADFFALRLRRLHPLVVLGATIGLLAYLFDPFAPAQRHAPLGLVAITYGLALFLLPGPGLPGRVGPTHPLNGPSWSLGQEYLANVAYALVARSLGPRSLAALVAVSAVALFGIGVAYNTLHVGWGWDTIWLAPLRTAFPFFCGLLMQRLGVRLRIPGGWTLLSVVLLATFLAPTLPIIAGINLNGLFEAVVVVGLFPLIIACAAAAAETGVFARLCRLSGEISYPIYILHFPVIQLFASWVWSQHPPHALVLAVGGSLTLCLPGLAWLALKFYDEPVRELLGRSGFGRPVGAASPAKPAAAGA
jgi:peptidoglycan/LPS O-acetylase OafA/YrhL